MLSSVHTRRRAVSAEAQVFGFSTVRSRDDPKKHPLEPGGFRRRWYRVVDVVPYKNKLTRRPARPKAHWRFLSSTFVSITSHTGIGSSIPIVRKCRFSNQVVLRKSTCSPQIFCVITAGAEARFEDLPHDNPHARIKVQTESSVVAVCVI